MKVRWQTHTYINKAIKFAIAYRGDCCVQSLDYPTNDFSDQELINSYYYKGYCSEKLFSIKLGNANVVVVHIQIIDSRREIKELSKYSQRQGLSTLSTYMMKSKPDVVVGDFNLHKEDLRKKLIGSNSVLGNTGYSFIDFEGQNVSGSNIHHALIRNNDARVKCISYTSDVQTHLTTAMHIEIS